MNKLPIIIYAINNRSVLKFKYKGFDRVVEPHAVGVSKKGNTLMRCYQVSGGSYSGNVPDWKLMSVGKISSLEISQTSFSEPRDGYVRGDKCMRKVLAQL